MKHSPSLLAAAIALALCSTAFAADPAPATKEKLPDVNVKDLPKLPDPPASQAGDGSTPERFGEIVDQVIDLSPDQIRKLRKILDKAQRASAESPTTPAKPVATSIEVSLAPGVVPPVIRLNQSFVSSLVFLDSTGNKWPIIGYSVGNPDMFDLSPKDMKANADQVNYLTIVPQTTYGYSNVAVFLKDLPTPVMLTLASGQKEVDYRSDIRVQARGPNAPAQVGQKPPSMSHNKTLMSVLDGVTPDGAQELKSSDGTVRAWTTNGKMYIRTTFNMVSPAWTDYRKSADGTNAYEVQETPVILISAEGRLKQVKLDGLKWSNRSAAK